MTRASGMSLLAALALCVTTVPVSAAGPDIYVVSIQDVRYWGAVGSTHAYSLGTTSCNQGDTDAQWIATTPAHPVIAQNMYRLKNGRFEQIGLSWLKHGYTTINNGLCGTCNGNLGPVLGVGCSDPYGSFLNGIQTGLGPRFEVNPVTGEFPYPFFAQNISGDTIYKRIQVAASDLEPGNSAVTYYVGAHYITADDAQAGNGLNNASYRRFQLAPNFSMTPIGTTQAQKSAVQAWSDQQVGVATSFVDVRQDGRIWVGSSATSLGGGMYRYEYAVENLNSHRAAREFRVPVPDSAVIVNVGFHDVSYHSGEPFDGTDWPHVADGNYITWNTDTFASNQNANAIRWGTLYNFYFDCDSPPVAATAAIGLFRPGMPGNCFVSVVAPAPADCNGNDVADETDIANTTSSDCQTNGVPDECELLANDCNTNLVPDECELVIDCNGNLVPDVCELTANDCNSDGVPDDCQIDCDTDGVIDACDSEDDCDTNGVPDHCEVDCNTNAVSDACDIAIGGDCNTDGVPDPCTLAELFDDLSAVQSPFHGEGGASLSYSISAPPTAASPVIIVVTAKANLGLAIESALLSINGFAVEQVFSTNVPDCSETEEVITLEASTWNALVGGGDAMITLVAEATVNQASCPTSFATVRVTYLPERDCNQNGVLDECELAAMTSPDCNTNGRLDDCELSELFAFQSAMLSPIGATSPQSTLLPVPPVALGDVVLTVRSNGDYALNSDYVEIDINGTVVANIFESRDQPCTIRTEDIVVSAATFNAAVAGGNALIGFTPSAGVDAALCGSPWIEITVRYLTSVDGGGDGILDVCQNSGCVCGGDMNGDGIVDGDDVQLFVSGVISGTFDPCLNLSPDLVIDSQDVAGFVSVLLAGNACP